LELEDTLGLSNSMTKERNEDDDWDWNAKK
jgi:hypothetical protein